MGEQELYNINLDDLNSQNKEVVKLLEKKRAILRKIKALKEKDLQVRAFSPISSMYFEGYFDEEEIKDMLISNLLDELEETINDIKSITKNMWSDTHSYIYNQRNKDS